MLLRLGLPDEMVVVQWEWPLKLGYLFPCDTVF